MGRVIALVLLAGCGANPQNQCKDAAVVTCAKLFECWTTAPERVHLMLGATADECTELSVARCAAGCEKPKTWDTTAADQCISEFTAITCSMVRSGTTPASCSNTCK